MWATSGNKAAEQMLLGSIIECVDPGSKNVTYYTTATSGDLVSGAPNQEKLSLLKNSGTGATTKKTGAELTAMGIGRIALGVLTHGQHAGDGPDQPLIRSRETILRFGYANKLCYYLKEIASSAKSHELHPGSVLPP